VPAACGDEQEDGRSRIVPGRTLTIYTSLPRAGGAGEATQDMLRAQRLALQEARGRVGAFRVRLVAVDNAAPETGTWDADRTAVNARAALRDATTIAYLGEWDEDATRISLPIFNEAGILQVSATNTYAGLTRADGAAAGEPERFFPSGQRTYARVVPADHAQAAALATLMQEVCFEVHLVDDGQPEGQGMALMVRREAREQELDVSGTDSLGVAAGGRREVEDRIARSGADCVLLAAGEPSAEAVELLRDLRAARPAVRFFAPAGLAEPGFLRSLGPAVEAQLRITTPTLAPSAYPAASERFFEAFQDRFGHPPDIRALYGYEAVRAVLGAIDEAGELGNDRSEVIRAFFGIDDRESVLGTYDIDDSGDTTLPVYGANRVRDGRLIFDGVVELSDG
jgi:branched-chain amino acid transport system substrate-binding protein